MRRFLCLSILVNVLVFPMAAFAEEGITRREGFLQIWESIKRPVFPTREKPFSDVPKGSHGFATITYAKARGLLNDDAPFRPNQPLLLSEALVMMMRLQNIADPDEISTDTLPMWLEKYPLGDFVDSTIGVVGTLKDREIDREELGYLMQKFSGLLSAEDHEVSLYAEKFHGKGTAFGETFDMHDFTAAHRTFPHNTLVKVTNIENGESVVVRINDRGPYVEGRDMDLSLASFTLIADRSQGKFRATFERLGDASLVDAKPATVVRKIDNCPTGRILERLLERARKRGITLAECGV